MDEEDGVLLPIPRPMPDPSEQESLRAQIQNEKEVALAKRFRIRDALQSSWQAQVCPKPPRLPPSCHARWLMHESRHQG